MNSEQENQELLKLLHDQKLALDHAAIVAVTDARGVITSANEKFCQISGFAREELVGRDHRIINSGFHPSSFFDNMWKTISAGNVWTGDVCNRTKNGDLYWVATTITPFVGENGRPYRYLAIRQDITDLKNAQKVIEEQQAQLISASRLSAIGEMAAAITHEINNPLTVILGRAEMIQSMAEREPINPADLKRIVETILVTGRRIEKIVKSMRSLAHHGSETEPFSKNSIQEILSDSLELCSQRFRNHGIRLTLPQSQEDVQISCRGHEIVQVLVNMLNNAHDAVLNLEERWVKVDISKDERSVQISFTDSGKGIPEEVQKKLFTPFFSTKREQFGTGLGLSISRNIISKHKGELTYDSSSPYTRFVINLPRLSQGRD